MQNVTIEPNLFKIKQLQQKIGLAEILKNGPKDEVIVTFNQLMKRNDKIEFIFIFDENSIEIFPLISYCNYFNIQMYKLDEEETKEIKEVIKYTQMVCITSNLKIKNRTTNETSESSTSFQYKVVFDNLLKIDLNSK